MNNDSSKKCVLKVLTKEKIYNDYWKNSDAKAKVGLTAKKIFDQVVLVGIFLHQAKLGMKYLAGV